MFKKIIQTIKGCFGYFLLVINTLFIAVFFIPIGYIKKFSSNVKIKTSCLKFIHKLGWLWITINYLIIKYISRVKISIEGLESLNNLSKQRWYLLISNHQSWTDVLVLQLLLKGKIPFQKYFVKEEMRKFPIMGFVWESMDCAFLKRAKLKTGLAGNNDDINNIKNTCRAFKLIPSTVVSFAEGTRFTLEKHNKQQSPFRFLLKPKAGGIASVLEEMEQEIEGIVDLTLCYQPRHANFWDLLSGRLQKITARIQFITIPGWLVEKHKNNIEYSNYKNEFHDWLNNIWLDKDEYLSQKYQ